MPTAWLVSACCSCHSTVWLQDAALNSCAAAHHAFQKVVCDVHGAECIALDVLADLLSTPEGRHWSEQSMEGGMHCC